MTMLAGASMIYGPGMLENGMVMNLGQLVADADLINMLKFAQKGLTISDEKLALDVIREVGIKGEYLSCNHTFQNFKTEQSNPFIMNRDNRDEWLGKGAPSAYDTGCAKAREILMTGKKQYVTDEAAKAMSDIIAEAEAGWK